MTDIFKALNRLTESSRLTRVEVESALGVVIQQQAAQDDELALLTGEAGPQRREYESQQGNPTLGIDRVQLTEIDLTAGLTQHLWVGLNETHYINVDDVTARYGDKGELQVDSHRVPPMERCALVFRQGDWSISFAFVDCGSQRDIHSISLARE